jgi:hypothetical protein
VFNELYQIDREPIVDEWPSRKALKSLFADAMEVIMYSSLACSGGRRDTTELELDVFARPWNPRSGRNFDFMVMPEDMEPLVPFTTNTRDGWRAEHPNCWIKVDRFRRGGTLMDHFLNILKDSLSRVEGMEYEKPVVRIMKPVQRSASKSSCSSN